MTGTADDEDVTTVSGGRQSVLSAAGTAGGGSNSNAAGETKAVGNKGGAGASASDPLPTAVEFEPPFACVRRILKTALPASTNVGKDASAAFARASGIFIIYLTACANDFARENKRQTITANDVLAAVKELDFEEFTPDMVQFLEHFRSTEKSKRDAKTKSKAATTTTSTTSGGSAKKAPPPSATKRGNASGTGTPAKLSGLGDEEEEDEDEDADEEEEDGAEEPPVDDDGDGDEEGDDPEGGPGKEEEVESGDGAPAAAKADGDEGDEEEEPPAKEVDGEGNKRTSPDEPDSASLSPKRAKTTEG